MARRQPAWAYRNSEVRRLTQAAGLVYPGDLASAVPPVNLEDLYEDDELRNENDNEEAEVSTVPLTPRSFLPSRP
jgi:hypothetical protein